MLESSSFLIGGWNEVSHDFRGQKFAGFVSASPSAQQLTSYIILLIYKATKSGNFRNGLY